MIWTTNTCSIRQKRKQRSFKYGIWDPFTTAPWSAKHRKFIPDANLPQSDGQHENPFVAFGIKSDWVWDMAWYPHITQDECKRRDVPILGVLATVNGDGVLRIYNVPTPDHVYSAITDGKTYLPMPVIDLKPAFEAKLDGSHVFCKVAWSHTEPWLVAAATFDGAIAFYKLDDVTRVVDTVAADGQAVPTLECTIPTSQLLASTSYTTGLSWSTNSSLIGQSLMVPSGIRTRTDIPGIRSASMVAASPLPHIRCRPLSIYYYMFGVVPSR